MKYLLDTCVISELIKPKPYQPVTDWILRTDEKSLYISVLTIGEIYKGIAKLSDSVKKDKLLQWVEEDLTYRFENRILDITPEIAKAWGILQGHWEKHGMKMPVIDSLIAISALVNDFTVVTRNESDMKKSGATILNLWVAS